MLHRNQQVRSLQPQRGTAGPSELPGYCGGVAGAARRDDASPGATTGERESRIAHKYMAHAEDSFRGEYLEKCLK
jgi:hypothetical protein